MDQTPFLRSPQPAVEFYDTHIPNAWVNGNEFIKGAASSAALPLFQEARMLLPDPFWDLHPGAINCYWRAWELAFSNLKIPSAQNDFYSNYCDTAFNGNLFLWDSSFITGYGLYGRRAFNFQGTLDNFYRKQHKDGFICREISEVDGKDCFHRFDPSSTGPNVLAWAEWNYFKHSQDWNRLEKAFPVLVAYHQWLRAYRTWQDGSYWSTGWGTGMDNLPRVMNGDDISWAHGHMTWVDATLQAILSARILLRIAGVLGREKDIFDLELELDQLTRFSNTYLWDKDINFYFDRFATGQLSSVKHIGAFWALLAGIASTDQVSALVAHLENPAEFKRPHRVPALSADDPHYGGTGNYWCGGVWAPTNYMVLKGLDEVGQQDLAHRIAVNHLESVVSVFESDNTRWTGADQFRKYFQLDDLRFDDSHTLWEDYAPDVIQPGGHSKPGYVGWTGLPPIAVLFEDVFGLFPDAGEKRLTWHVRQLAEHGVKRYPFGANGSLDLKCAARHSQLERPSIEIKPSVPVTVEVIWEGGSEIIHSQP